MGKGERLKEKIEKKGSKESRVRGVEGKDREKNLSWQLSVCSLQKEKGKR
jgi:hypothetical protein